MSLSEKKDSKRCTIESHLISDNRLSIRILFAYRFRHYPRVTCTSSHAGIDCSCFTICFSENWCRYGQSDIWLIATLENKRDVADFFKDTIDNCFSNISILFLLNDVTIFSFIIIIESLSLREIFNLYIALHSDWLCSLEAFGKIFLF